MAKRSAGLLIFKHEEDQLCVLLVHPGGPFWSSKRVGAWQIPKGLIKPGEDTLVAALREAQEELGVRIGGPAHSLGSIRQAGGKHVDAFALRFDFDVTMLASNSFEMEWPPRSGKQQSFPEVDEARWFFMAQARAMILTSQAPFLDRLEDWFWLKQTTRALTQRGDSS